MAVPLHFGSVRKAREALRERAFETYELLLSIIKQAAANQDFETAAKYTWMLLEHTPSDGDDQRVLDISVNKPKEVETKAGPTVNIGFQLGGMQQPKELPPPIEAEAIEIKDE